MLMTDITLLLPIWIDYEKLFILYANIVGALLSEQMMLCSIQIKGEKKWKK